MEKIIFFGLVIPIMAYVLYLGGTAIMNGFKSKEANRIEKEEVENEIKLSFDVPYDWSIDTDWEDKALVLLGLCDEWVIDSSVEDK